MTRISKYENVLIRDYKDAQEHLVVGSIVMDIGHHTPCTVIVDRVKGHDLYGYYEDGIGQPLMLDGAPYKLPRGDIEEYVTLYTPQEGEDDQE